MRLPRHWPACTSSCRQLHLSWCSSLLPCWPPLQAFHTGLPLTAAAEETPAINPLQQAPVPAVARSALAAAAADADAEAPLRARAILRNAAISPRKLNMFAKLVRGLSLADALIQCEISCKKSAGLLRNVLLSAKANAINNHGMDGDKLVVGASVGAGGLGGWLLVLLVWRSPGLRLSCPPPAAPLLQPGRPAGAQPGVKVLQASRTCPRHVANPLPVFCCARLHDSSPDRTEEAMRPSLTVLQRRRLWGAGHT